LHFFLFNIILSGGADRLLCWCCDWTTGLLTKEWVAFLGHKKEIFLFQHPVQLWDSPSLLSAFWMQSGWHMKLTIYLHLVPRERMGDARLSLACLLSDSG
jgi:hypothetical protein